MVILILQSKLLYLLFARENFCKTGVIRVNTKLKTILLVLLISISITGCVSQGTASNSSDLTEPRQLPNHLALEAYKAVLHNDAEFFSTDNNKSLLLDDFLVNNQIYETIFEITHFTLLDMDNDNVPEVVLELSVNGYPQFYEVLHYKDGTVYGYLFVYRGLMELKEDGTFIYSSGAADSGVAKLNFDSNTVKTDVLGYSQSSQGETDLVISYFINDEPVDKESFDSFIIKQSEKKDTVWYEFSKENTEAVLSAV